MTGSEANKKLDEAIERARENRLLRERQNSWYTRAKSEQDRIDAENAAKFPSMSNEGYIYGPLAQEDIDAFMQDYRDFRKDQEACNECRALEENDPEARARPMCSLHMGWGHGICWKRGR